MDDEQFGTTADYLSAFRDLRAAGIWDKSDKLLRMRQAHLAAPGHTTTAARLAKTVGYPCHRSFNSAYGNFAKKVANKLGYTEKHRVGDWVSVLVRDGGPDPDTGDTRLVLRHPVVKALRQLGREDEVASGLLPGESEPGALIREGAWKQALVNAYERNPQARKQCLEAHGTTCCICEFDFDAVYGLKAEGLIHVHHVNPLSEAGGEHDVDPVKDLLPVCPNCHAVLHLGGGFRSVEEVQQLLTRQRLASRRNRKWS